MTQGTFAILQSHGSSRPLAGRVRGLMCSISKVLDLTRVRRGLAGTNLV